MLEVKKILIVEDDSNAAETLCDFLESYGVDSVTIEDGNAFDSTFSSEFDAAILDINIGGSADGFELLAKIKQSPFPVFTIIATARDIQENREKSISLGADYFFGKPIDLEELTRVLGLHRNEGGKNE